MVLFQLRSFYDSIIYVTAKVKFMKIQGPLEVCSSACYSEQVSFKVSLYCLGLWPSEFQKTPRMVFPCSLCLLWPGAVPSTGWKNFLLMSTWQIAPLGPFMSFHTDKIELLTWSKLLLLIFLTACHGNSYLQPFSKWRYEQVTISKAWLQMHHKNYSMITGGFPLSLI